MRSIVAAAGLGLALFTAVPAVAATDPMQWTSLVSAATGANGAITKVPGNWYASANGTRTLTGDARVEFRVSDTGANPYVNAMYVCLNSGSYDVGSLASFEHCAVIGAGYASAYVQGRWSSDVAITTGDLLAVGVEGGVVRFYRNGTAFYTSGLAPAFPVTPVFMTTRDGYGLTAAYYTSPGTTASAPPPSPAPASEVAWTQLVQATAPGTGAIRKLTGPSWYGAGVSTQALAGDGRFEAQVNDTGASPYVNAMQLCLNSGSYSIYDVASLEYCLNVGAGYVSAYSGGQWRADTALATTDRIAVGVEGGVVKYWKNGVVFYASPVAPTFPLTAVFTSNHDGYGLTGANVAGGSAGATAPAPAPAPTNGAPVISGTGTRTVRVGEAYSFTPTASDPDGNPLRFSVAGSRPAWLAFDAATGRLSGTAPAGSEGTYPMTLTVSDGSLTSSLSLSVTVVTANRAPTITGATTATANVGQAYAYTPAASDPDGDRVSYSVSGLPSWATFDVATGRIAGTPQATNVGTSTIRITVSDGSLSASLQLTLSVVAASGGNLTLSWTPPVTRTDGSTLTNLASYRIYYGTAADSLTNTIVVSNPSLSTYVVSNLAPGTWYFAMSAVDASGLESARTGTVAGSAR